MTSKQEWTPERDVAASIMPGDTMLETVRKMRQENLFEGEDFRIVRSGVEYSPDGIKKTLALIHVTAPESPIEGTDIPPDAEPDPAKKTPPAGVPAVPASVLKVWPNNPHYLLAKLSGAEITICVKEARNFIPGMEIPGEHLKRRGQFSQIYDFVGRCPRGRGRW